jgi:AraC-like DNA-binding protein
MDSPTNPSWWPARLLRQNPLRKIFACDRQLHPPLYSHVVNFPRLEIPLRGIYKNQIEIANEITAVSVQPGNALFAAPNCWNLPEWQPGLELLSILFGRTQLGISLISARSKNFTQLTAKKISLTRPLTGPIPHIVNALVELQANDGSSETFVELTRALMRCVEELLLQPVTQPASRAQTLLEDIRVYLQSHYQYEITRDSVARQFAISPNHLSRLFQTHGQMTFSSYLTQVRIDRAKHLLRSYNLKLDDIAARCGYNDTPYFCHVFKKITKSTPAAFRLKSHRPPAA